MAKYPKVYGHCDAGCKRRVPTYDEFVNSATLVGVDDFEDRWISGNKKYRIYSTHDGLSYDAEISVSENAASATRYLITFTKLVGFAFQEYFDFELVRNYLDGSAFVIEYKINGDLKKWTLDDGQPHAVIENPILLIQNATRVLQHNDGTIVVQGGEDGFSPKVSVTKIEGGHRVRITDELGAHDFDVMDGEDGQNDVFIVNVSGNEEDGYTADCSHAKIHTEATVNKKVVIARLGNQVFYLSKLTYTALDTIDFVSVDVGDSVEVTRLRISGNDVSDNPVVIVETVEGGQGGGTGKSAYEYAKEGGYTGTESEFSEMLAGIDEDSVVIVNVTGNETDGYTADKTFAEIVSAELAGKVVQVYHNGRYHQLSSALTSTQRWYSSFVANGGVIGGTTVIIRTRDGVDAVLVKQAEINASDIVSPTVSVDEIEGGHRITVTDAEGDKTFDVMNGANGQDGINGKDGEAGVDGKTPVFKVESGNLYVRYSDTEEWVLLGIVQGAAGKDGTNGRDGVDGNDYVLTDADKAEIAREAEKLIDTSSFATKEYVVELLGVIENGTY